MKLFLRFLIIATVIFLSTESSAQGVAINNDGSPASANAMLDISSNNKGVLLPRLTTLEMWSIPSPDPGLLIYNSDTKSFWFYVSAYGWSEISHYVSDIWIDFGVLIFNKKKAPFTITNNNATPMDGQLAVNNALATTNTVEPVLSLWRGSTGIPANGIGGAMNFWNQGTGGLSYLSGRVATVMENVSNGTSAMRFDVNSGGGVQSSILFLRPGTVGINNTNPDATVKLDVNGAVNMTGVLKMNGATGSSGQVLTSNGAAAPTWQTPSSNPQIGFFARPSAATVTIATSTLTTLTAYTESFDDGNNFDPVAGEFTAPSAGMYHFDLKITFNSSPSVTNVNISSRVHVNGAAAPGAVYSGRLNTNGTYPDAIMLSTNCKLNAGDKVTAVVFHNTGANHDIIGSGSTGSTYFSGFKVY